MAGKFMYGIGRLQFKEKTLGYIKKGSFQLNGTHGESAPVHAEQVPGGPVHNIPQSNGSIAPTFNMIEWDYEMMEALMGGKVNRNAEGVAIGWSAPGIDLVETRGKFVIETVAKKRISIYACLLQGVPDGGLDLTDVAQINIKALPEIPVDGSAPYDIVDIDDVEWAQIMAEEAAKRKAASASPKQETPAEDGAEDPEGEI
jgi:hypothetical protein